jgi:hypothetical protein
MSHADAIVFEPRFAAGKPLPAQRNRNQYYVFASHETPVQKDVRWAMPKLPKHYFNLSMTYRRDADVSSAYGHFEPIGEDTDEEEVWQWADVRFNLLLIHFLASHPFHQFPIGFTNFTSLLKK